MFVIVGVTVTVGVCVKVGEGPAVTVKVGVKVAVGPVPDVRRLIASTSLAANPQTLPSKNKVGE